MRDCNLLTASVFDNLPLRHVISNFCPSLASNLLEVR